LEEVGETVTPAEKKLLEVGARKNDAPDEGKIIKEKMKGIKGRKKRHGDTKKRPVFGGQGHKNNSPR